MKKKYLYLLQMPITILFLASSTCTPKMTVGLPYAKTNGRKYINTGLHNFGTFYVWDMKAETLSQVAILDEGLTAKPVESKVVKQSLSSGFELTFSGNIPANATSNPEFVAEASRQVSNESSITLKGVRTRRFQSGYNVLNGKKTVTFRKQMAEQFGHEPARYRFVFIQGQIEADNAEFKVTRSSDNKITVSEPSVGSVEFVVNTSGVNQETYEGKATPVLLEVSLLRLISSPQTRSRGAGYKFVLDTESANKVLTRLLRG